MEKEYNLREILKQLNISYEKSKDNVYCFSLGNYYYEITCKKGNISHVIKNKKGSRLKINNKSKNFDLLLDLIDESLKNDNILFKKNNIIKFSCLNKNLQQEIINFGYEINYPLHEVDNLINNIYLNIIIKKLII